MITVNGTARLRVDYTVELDMTEEEFDALSEDQQNQLLDSRIDWMDACSQAELDDIGVDDVIEEEDDIDDDAIATEDDFE